MKNKSIKYEKNLALYWLLCIPIILLVVNANAEYRAYQYLVKPTHNYLKNQNVFLITSALDPVSYVSYHGGSQTLSVELIRTWMCPGYTGQYKDLCKSPYKQITPRDLQINEAATQ